MDGGAVHDKGQGGPDLGATAGDQRIPDRGSVQDSNPPVDTLARSDTHSPVDQALTADQTIVADLAVTADQGVVTDKAVVTDNATASDISTPVQDSGMDKMSLAADGRSTDEGEGCDCNASQVEGGPYALILFVLLLMMWRRR